MLRFHHLGVATRSLTEELGTWTALGYKLEGAEFADPVQGIRGQFLIGGGPRLELLAPLEGSETLTPILKRGIKLYHHGYEVASVHEAIETLRSQGARVIRAPAPAVAFNGRLIAFLATSNNWIVELIETAL